MFDIGLDNAPQYTAIPDSFVTKYLPDAPGDYVKVYIYVYMLAAKNNQPSSIDALSSMLFTTNEQIISAFEYWEDKQLLSLYYTDCKLTGIKLSTEGGGNSASECRVSRSQSKALLNDNDDAKTLCFVAERYIGRPLKPNEIETLLYFLIDLKFPLELCDYLVEYCVSRGYKSIRYIESVGLDWHKRGIKTVEDARARSSGFSKRHFDVLKAFGIRGRNPIDKEIEFIDKWFDEFGFSFDIIKEACGMTVMSPGNKGFQYADGILSHWHDSGVKTLEEARKITQEFKSKKSSSSKDGNKRTNKFINFKQRDNDLDAVARKLNEQLMQKMENNDGAD